MRVVWLAELVDIWFLQPLVRVPILDFRWHSRMREPIIAKEVVESLRKLLEAAGAGWSIERRFSTEGDEDIFLDCPWGRCEFFAIALLA